MTLLLKNSENCTCICRQFFIFKHRVYVHLKAYTNYFNKKIYSGVCCCLKSCCYKAKMMQNLKGIKSRKGVSKIY